MLIREVYEVSDSDKPHILMEGTSCIFGQRLWFVDLGNRYNCEEEDYLKTNAVGSVYASPKKKAA